MSSAKITLIGMNQYDENLFDKMILPEGIDRDLFIDSLILKAGEFEVLYSNPEFFKRAIGAWSHKWYRTFAEWLRGQQASWNPIENYDRYEETTDVFNKKYGSLNNADYTSARLANLTDKRTADLTDRETVDLRDSRTVDLKDDLNHGQRDAHSLNLKDQRVPNLTEETKYDSDVKHSYNSNTTTTQTSDDVETHKVSAFDSTSFRNSTEDTIHKGPVKSKRDGDDTDKHNGSDTVKTTGNDTTSHTGTDTHDITGRDVTTHTGTDSTGHTGNDVKHLTGTDTNTTTGTDENRVSGKLSDLSGSEDSNNAHSSHIHGNIGVTQASDMLRSFYDISEWNLYEHMCDVFSRELLICVY